MSRRRKNPIDFSDLAACIEDRDAKRQRERASEEKKREARFARRRALQKAAWGTEQEPLGVDRVIVDRRNWSKWIFDAAQAWRRRPGTGVIKNHPALIWCPELEAAERLFLHAASSTEPEAVERNLFQYERVLGEESLLGLVAYLRALADGYDGDTWRPRGVIHDGVQGNPTPTKTSGQPEKQPSSSRRVRKDPVLEVLRESRASLKQQHASKLLNPREIMSLYGIAAMSSSSFNRSTKYVSRKDKPSPWQLPARHAGRGRGEHGEYESKVNWPVKDVRSAIAGWIERLERRSGSQF